MAADVAGLGVSVLVSAWSAWAVLARAGRAGHLSPFGMKLSENAGAS